MQKINLLGLISKKKFLQKSKRMLKNVENVESTNETKRK